MSVLNQDVSFLSDRVSIRNRRFVSEILSVSCAFAWLTADTYCYEWHAADVGSGCPVSNLFDAVST